ncbi:MAG TPA: penicillin-binding transpeptidase domain-containing protein [Paenibacillus sp.]
MSLARKNRIFYILIVFSILFVVYTLRIAWIQTHAALAAVTSSGKTINELAVRQREQGVELDPGRGNFFDRYGRQLTGITTWSPVLFPVKRLPAQDDLARIAATLGVSESELRSKWASLEVPFIWSGSGGNYGLLNHSSEIKAQSLAHLEGIEVLPHVVRYQSGQTGQQWLGYVAQRPEVIQQIRGSRKQNEQMPLTMQVGAAGLEKTFDRFLRGAGSTRAYYAVDGKRESFPNVGTRIKGPEERFHPLQIKTTIDIVLQKKLEALTEQMDVKEGAVVVLDAENGDVLAMVSRPFFDPNHIDLAGGSWSNRALKAVPPGSIFKTVIAAAALDSGVTKPGEVFHCSGQYGKYGLACWKKGGHGDLTLEQGFAYSCNNVFATLGERLSARSIELTAARLGLGRKIGWHEEKFMGGKDLWQFDHEEEGEVFHSSNPVDGGVLAQTAIGQRDVLVSPLQAANMIVTLLHQGRVTSPRLVSEIRFRDGSLLTHMPEHRVPTSAGQVSPRTSSLLLSWMNEVVTSGTGRSLRQADWHLAGKSGTAQVAKGDKNYNHQWFIGYGPTEKPKYAVSVLVQYRPEGSENQATALFRHTMDLLAAYRPEQI